MEVGALSRPEVDAAPKADRSSPVAQPTRQAGLVASPARSRPAPDDALAARLQRAVQARTSPPTDVDVSTAIEEGEVELTTPRLLARNGGGGAAGPPAVPVQNPKGLTVKGKGSIEGTFGIGDYWPVTKYWGADKTLGAFDEPAAGGWRMYGHKFQVIGQFASGTTTTGTGGPVTFLQEARITNTKGGSPGAWFNDMDYTDASGGAHTWDPNAENGTTGATGYAGVRRTISTTKYAYTDPPAIGYQPGTTDAYRKLEFRITLQAPPGSPKPSIVKTATQEIEIVKGKPKTLKAP